MKTRSVEDFDCARVLSFDKAKIRFGDEWFNKATEAGWIPLTDHAAFAKEEKEIV